MTLTSTCVQSCEDGKVTWDMSNIVDRHDCVATCNEGNSSDGGSEASHDGFAMIGAQKGGQLVKRDNWLGY